MIRDLPDIVSRPSRALAWIALPLRNHSGGAHLDTSFLPPQGPHYPAAELLKNAISGSNLGAYIPAFWLLVPFPEPI